MSFIKLLSLLSIFVLVSACSNGSGGGSGGGGGTTPNANGEISYEQAKQRWPGTGSYSNSFSYNGCTDSYDYGNQADYCLALTDDLKAKCESSNYDSRKVAYSENCGDDFSPRNIKSPYSVLGFDSHLNKRCEVTTEKRFASVKQLCDYFKDETINQGCFWARRKSFFENYKCSGEFSSQPAAVPESSLSQPPASQPSAPLASPNTLDPWQGLVRKYQSSGIELKKSSQVISDPSGPSFFILMKAFIPVLSDLLPEFIQRVTTINRISVGSYTSYDYSSQTLYLGANLKKSELMNYLAFHDQRMDLIRLSGVSIDFGVEVHSVGTVADDFLELQNKIKFFLAKISELKNITPLIRSISFGTSNIARFYSKTLDFTPDKYQEQFSSQVSILKPLAVLARAGIEFESYLDLEDKQSGLARFSKWLLLNSKTLTDLKNLYGGLTIEVTVDGDVHSARFMTGLKKLRVEVGTSSFEVEGLKTLLTIVPLLKILGYPAEIDDDDLGSDFIKCAKLFVNANSKIANVKSKITDIKLGGYKSDYYSGHLIIGQDSTSSDLDAVLKTIK